MRQLRSKLLVIIKILFKSFLYLSIFAHLSITIFILIFTDDHKVCFLILRFTLEISQQPDLAVTVNFPPD